MCAVTEVWGSMPPKDRDKPRAAGRGPPQGWVPSVGGTLGGSLPGNLVPSQVENTAFVPEGPGWV